jgi:hypothetical protein
VKNSRQDAKESIQGKQEILQMEEQETPYAMKVTAEKREKLEKRELSPNGSGKDRRGFINGLSVGLGIGCISTFIIMWISIFFSPMLPSRTTYETLLTIFIYPLIYLLAVGLIALTAGIVKEYYSSPRRL